MEFFQKLDGYKTYIVAIALFVWKIVNGDVAGIEQTLHEAVPYAAMIIMRVITTLTTLKRK
jgi:hypothetical protein